MSFQRTMRMKMVGFQTKYQWKEATNQCVAENYYTADYPDEDLDWDDQFDRNPYRFATGNGSDEDEDEDDDGNDDDQPWEEIRNGVRNMMF